MKNEADSRQDSNRNAVIRHYEPTRIERELLAQVFELASDQSGDEERVAEQASVSSPLCNFQAADDNRSRRGLVPNAAGLKSLEPAA